MMIIARGVSWFLAYGLERYEQSYGIEMIMMGLQYGTYGAKTKARTD